MVSSTPRPHFSPGKDPIPIVQETGWAPGSVWTDGKSRPHRDSITDRPTRSSVTIATELPGPRYQYIPFIYVREVAGSRSGERRSFIFVVRWPEVTMKGKGYGLRMCKKCHLSILIYYPNTIRLHKILLSFLLFFYGASVHFQAMASPISCLHRASSLLPFYTCRDVYQRHHRLFSKLSSPTHPASCSTGTRVSSADVK